MGEHPDTAQVELEQRALENVRALVDKLEADDRLSAASGWRSAIVLVSVVAVVCGLAILIAASRSSPATTMPSEYRVAQRVAMSTIAQVPSPPPIRKAFVATGKGTRFEAYVAAFVSKVESTANSNYPAALRGLGGKVQLTAAIRPEGSVQGIEINVGSGEAKLDAAAADFVRRAFPFDKFSDYGLDDVDLLYITRTFAFEAPHATTNGAR